MNKSLKCDVMEYELISDYLSLATLVLVVIGFILLFYLTYKYEKLAFETPDRGSEFRMRKKKLLGIYLRAVILVFAAALITYVIAIQ